MKNDRRISKQDVGGVEQLALAVETDAPQEVGRFLRAASNLQALTWLSRLGWPGRRLLIWGPRGCGKTHLLRLWACCRATAIYEGSALPLALPSGLRAAAIDNLDDVRDEVRFFHLLNAAHDNRQELLLAARCPPSRASYHLQDLASRLRAINAVAIGSADDALRRSLLMMFFAERQLIIPQDVTDWLWRHLPRDSGALLDAAMRLDQAGLARGKAVTRELARDVLSDLLSGEDDASPGPSLLSAPARTT